MIEFLLFAGLVAQVGVVRSAGGEQIDFGPGSQCMFALPQGFHVNAGSSDEYLIRFDNREKDELKYAWGSARLLDDVDIQERSKGPKHEVRTYKNATIEAAALTRGSVTANSYEVVIGRQVIRFSSLSEASIPKPEEVVDACGSSK